MSRDEHPNVRDALDLLRRALDLLDDMGLGAAAAQVDHIIHLLQAAPDHDPGR